VSIVAQAQFRAALIPLSATLFLAGCAVPLGRGFYFRTRQTQVSEVSEAPARIHVQVTDRLRNAGDRDLSFLDVGVPAGDSFRADNLSIHVDGKDAESSAARPGQASPLRLRFAPAWKQGDERTFVFDYDFEPAEAGREGVSVTVDSFHLADINVLPQWMLPPGPFSEGEERAHDEQLDVTAPSGFSVVAAGRLRNRKRQAGETVYRFRITPADVPLFVVAGRYHERRVRTEYGDVIFWTRAPLDVRIGDAAGRRLGSTVATFEKAFGPVPRGSWPVRVVESSAPLSPSGESAGLGADSFPHGVLLDNQAVAAGLGTEPVLEVAEYELARTWFGWVARPEPGAQILLGQGTGLFAVVLAAEARGGEDARRAKVAALLAGYDRAHREEAARPLIEVPAGSKRQERQLDAFEAALFFVALEDTVGADNLTGALRRMLQAREGVDVSPADLRSAMEAASGRDLAGMFHDWLDRLVVPDDFRTRYAGRG
jgi:hypothetical protein